MIIATAMVATMLVGCGAKEVASSAEGAVVEEVASAEEAVPTEEASPVAEQTGTEVESEVVEAESNTVDMTVEEYIRALVTPYDNVFSNNRPEEFVFAVKDVNNNEYEYSNIFSIQMGNEPYSEEEYANGALDTLNVVDIRNCIGLVYNQVDEIAYRTYNNGETIGLVQFVEGVGFNHPYAVSLDPANGINYVDEGVYMDVKFEYDANIDAVVLRSSDGVDIAYFGEIDIVEVDEWHRFMTFTTKFDEGDYVLYAWDSLLYGDGLLPTHMNAKEINFISHR